MAVAVCARLPFISFEHIVCVCECVYARIACFRVVCNFRSVWSRSEASNFIIIINFFFSCVKRHNFYRFFFFSFFSFFFCRIQSSRNFPVWHWTKCDCTANLDSIHVQAHTHTQSHEHDIPCIAWVAYIVTCEQTVDAYLVSIIECVDIFDRCANQIVRNAISQSERQFGVLFKCWIRLTVKQLLPLHWLKRFIVIIWLCRQWRWCGILVCVFNYKLSWAFIYIYVFFFFVFFTFREFFFTHCRRFVRLFVPSLPPSIKKCAHNTIFMNRKHKCATTFFVFSRERARARARTPSLAWSCVLFSSLFFLSLSFYSFLSKTVNSKIWKSKLKI